MIKRIAVLFALLLSFATHAQVTGPTTRTPRLTVNPGPTVVENLTINGTCTGCLVGAGANPTGTVGLTTVNGVATTLMRSDGAPALSQAIAPTWSAQHIFSVNPLISNGAAGLRWTETDATADQGNWLLRASSDGYDLCTSSDAAPTSCVGTIFRVLRTGTTPTTFTFPVAIPAFNGGASGSTAPFTVDSNTVVTNLNADLLDGISSASFAQLAAANDFTSALSGLSAPLRMNSATPGVIWSQSTGAVDNKHWRTFVSAEQLVFDIRNDASSSSATWMTVDRTGMTVDSVALASTALTWNGNTLFTTANDGAGSGLDADLLDGVSESSFGQLAQAETVTALWTFDGGGITVDDGGVRETACSLTLTGGGTFNNLDVFATCSPSGTHAILRITPDATNDSTITGIVLANNQKVTVVIPDPGSGLRAVILNHENASSTATNRLVLPSHSAQCTLNRGDSFIMWKDPTTDRVRIMNGDGYVCGA